MIDSNQDKKDFSSLGQGTMVKGDIIFNGDTILNSHITGDIIIANNSSLTLDRNSKVVGNIKCHDITIFGEVYGSVTSNGKLSIRSGAKVSGELDAKSLNIYPGSRVNIEGHTDNEEKT